MRGERLNSELTAIQVAHISEISGTVTYLAQYLEGKCSTFYRIYHPLGKSKNLQSVYCQNRTKVKSISIPIYGPIRYLFDLVLTLIWVNKVNYPIDKAIGMNCFDAFPLILFKKQLGICEVIFFNTDFSRKRFNNCLLNYIYICLDKYAAKHADKVCCNTQRAIAARIGEGVSRDKIVFTPNGVFLSEIGEMNLNKKNFKKKLVFVGYLDEEHGLVDIINLLNGIDAELDIIGTGTSEKHLRDLVTDRNLSHRVRFLGVKSHEDVISYLKKFSGFGLAPYSLKRDYIQYGDSLKVKEYLSCLVPVIVSDVPEISLLVKENHIGFVYGGNCDLAEALKRFNNLDENGYLDIIKRISSLEMNWDLNEIFGRLL